jgi:hypothetical protein
MQHKQLKQKWGFDYSNPRYREQPKTQGAGEECVMTDGGHVSDDDLERYLARMSVY